MRTFFNRTLLGVVTLLIGLPAYSANWDLDPGMSTVVFKLSLIHI